MPRLEFFVVSELVSVDQTTNKASIFNILEEIHAPQFPVIIPHCVATSLWCQQEEDHERDFQCVLRVTLPNGNTRDFASNFTLTQTRHRLIQALQVLPVTQPGELRFELLLNGVHAAQHIVTVEQVRPLDAIDSTVH